MRVAVIVAILSILASYLNCGCANSTPLSDVTWITEGCNHPHPLPLCNRQIANPHVRTAPVLFGHRSCVLGRNGCGGHMLEYAARSERSGGGVAVAAIIDM